MLSYCYTVTLSHFFLYEVILKPQVRTQNWKPKNMGSKNPATLSSLYFCEIDTWVTYNFCKPVFFFLFSRSQTLSKIFPLPKFFNFWICNTLTSHFSDYQVKKKVVLLESLFGFTTLWLWKKKKFLLFLVCYPDLISDHAGLSDQSTGEHMIVNL